LIDKKCVIDLKGDKEMKTCEERRGDPHDTFYTIAVHNDQDPSPIEMEKDLTYKRPNNHAFDKTT